METRQSHVHTDCQCPYWVVNSLLANAAETTARVDHDDLWARRLINTDCSQVYILLILLVEQITMSTVELTTEDDLFSITSSLMYTSVNLSRYSWDSRKWKAAVSAMHWVPMQIHIQSQVQCHVARPYLMLLLQLRTGWEPIRSACLLVDQLKPFCLFVSSVAPAFQPWGRGWTFITRQSE